MCRCGCGGIAEYLCSGGSPEGGYRDEPCCRNSAAYLHDCAAELGFSFRRRGVAGHAANGRPVARGEGGGR